MNRVQGLKNITAASRVSNNWVLTFLSNTETNSNNNNNDDEGDDDNNYVNNKKKLRIE